MHLSKPLKILLVTALVTLTSVAGWSNPASIPTGEWKFAGGKAEEVAMERSVDVAVDEMSFVMRPFARPKLKEVCAPWKTLRISLDGEDVTVSNGKVSLKSPLGKTVVRKLDGDDVKVRREFANGVLTATAWTDEGGRTNVFRVRDGKMVVESKVFSDQLPKPVVFSFTYE